MALRFSHGQVSMSKSKDKDIVPVKGGNNCKKCKLLMQRFSHSEHWKPLPGRNYYRYWDRCFSCSSIWHYEEAKVFLSPKKLVLKTASLRDDRSTFYQSAAWKKLRYQTLVKFGAKCQCCGVDAKQAPIRVDHIKPISKHWDLRLDPTNLQILCNDCNWGKSNWDETDWRE